MRRIAILAAMLLGCAQHAAAQPAESPFRENCSLYMERELSQVPFDNAAKYATMFVVASTIWETAPSMWALAREEAANDVRAALLRGAAHCLKDPEHRALAHKAIVIRKATKDWSGFETDLLRIANMPRKELYEKVVLAPGLFDDLEAGGETFGELGQVRRQIMTGRKPSFQADLKAKKTLAEIFADSCLPKSAESMIVDMRASMDAREDPAVREMVLAARALTGQPLSLDELRTFNAAAYLGSNAQQTSRFIGARGDFVMIQDLRPWSEEFLEKVKEDAPRHQALVERLSLHLRDAKLALEQCNKPRMIAAMQLVSREPGVLAANPIHRLISLAKGETDLSEDSELRMQIPTKDACYGGVVAQYNDLVEDFQRLRDVNIPGRDAQPFVALLKDADRAAQACNADQAEKLMGQAFELVPASLDPGNLCLNAERAERSYVQREAAISSQLQNCAGDNTGTPSMDYVCERRQGVLNYNLMKQKQKGCDEVRAQHGDSGRTQCNCCYTPENEIKGCFLWKTTTWVEAPDGSKQQKAVPLTPVPE